MSDYSKSRHLVLVPVPAYGHIRPLCALAGRLATKGNIVITILMAPTWLQKAQSDILAQFPTGHETLERIRLVSLFDSTETDFFALISKITESYPPVYEALFRGSAIRCASTGRGFSAVPPPTAVILDMLALPQLHATRSISGTMIPVFMFAASHAATLIRTCCPASIGGQGDLGPEIDAEALRLGKTADEVANEMFTHTDGTVIKIPGLPTMYDYEAFPQILIDGPVAALQKISYDMLLACDGVFVTTTPAYDGESLLAFQTWARQTLHKPVYAVGPLLPPEYGKEKTPISTGTLDVEMKAFLDSMGSKYGDNSVLFISFGSIFWPKVDTQLEDLVEALLEKEMPFILCHASPFAIVPDALSDKIKSSGIGMVTRWAPQQFIITHPATGWFLTHCGHGGVTESLASGVPMICWPFQADQPFEAVHLSENLNVAFHLIEVRTAKGLLPLHNGRVPRGTRDAVRAEFREVLDLCGGEVGREKRKNALRIRAEFASAWAAGGSSMMALNEFFAKYIPIP
ncbi:hypothetical protein B0H13DRAFT_892025 [Mycena leptocephala]|nr:hypothetical protein B0H13DRAFT_892025 [Mycena leptocephala]